MAAVVLAELSGDQLEARIGKLPPWAREYIGDLLAENEQLRDELNGVHEAEDFDEAIADLWQYIGITRIRSGDRVGGDRALRAASLLRDFP